MRPEKHRKLLWVEDRLSGVLPTLEERSTGVITPRRRFFSAFGEHRRYHTFTQRIRTDLCRRFYLVDPARIRNPFAVAGRSPLEWFLQTQVAQHGTNCEANLEYVRTGGRWSQFLTPSPLFPEADRLELLELGMQELTAGAVDQAWLFPQDWERLAAKWDARVFTESSDERLIRVSRPGMTEPVASLM